MLHSRSRMHLWRDFHTVPAIFVFWSGIGLDDKSQAWNGTKEQTILLHIVCSFVPFFTKKVSIWSLTVLASFHDHLIISNIFLSRFGEWFWEMTSGILTGTNKRHLAASFRFIQPSSGIIQYWLTNRKTYYLYPSGLRPNESEREIKGKVNCKKWFGECLEFELVAFNQELW